MSNKKIPPYATARQVYDLLVMYTSGLDFTKDEDIERYQNVLLLNFNGIKAFRSTIADVVTTVTRARLHDDPAQLFNNLKDLKYPPVDKARINRANAKGEPIFYCSDDPGTTIFEVRPQKIGDRITTIEVDFPVKGIYLLALGVEITNELGKNLSELEKGVHWFLREKFRTKVDPRESHFYNLTIAFVKMYMGDNHGVWYPSVASNLKGRNIALKTDFVDEFGKYGIATVHEVTAINSEFDIEVRCIYRCYERDNYGNLNWEEVHDCDGHSINESIYD